MKKCPFCAEEIQDAAVKCRFCGEFISQKPVGTPWYFKSSFLVLAFLMVGPFALPLSWFNPRHSVLKKVIITILALIITYFLTKATIASMRTLQNYYDELFEVLH